VGREGVSGQRGGRNEAIANRIAGRRNKRGGQEECLLNQKKRGKKV